jgi:hypothetical protein
MKRRRSLLNFVTGPNTVMQGFRWISAHASICPVQEQLRPTRPRANGRRHHIPLVSLMPLIWQRNTAHLQPL